MSVSVDIHENTGLISDLNPAIIKSDNEIGDLDINHELLEKFDPLSLAEEDISSSSDDDHGGNVEVLEDYMLMNNDLLRKEASTLDITDLNSSFISSANVDMRDSSRFNLKMDNFREKLQSARSHLMSVKPGSSLKSETNNDQLNVLELPSTIEDSFRLNVVDMNEIEDGFYDGRIIIQYKSKTDRSAKPLPLYSTGDQVLPDDFDLSLSIKNSFDSEEFTDFDQLRKSLRSSINTDKLRENFNDYDNFLAKDISFDELNTPKKNFVPYNESTNQLKLVSPPTTSYKMYSIEKGLRLITSGSSVEAMMSKITASTKIKRKEVKKLSEEELEKLKARRIKERTINHNDFEGFEEGDTLSLFKEVESFTETEKPEIEEADIEQSNKPESKFLRRTSTTTTYVKHYEYEGSDVSSISGGLYSGVSLLEIFANHIDRDFTALSEHVSRKHYAELQNKDDWINSLNSAFKINENLSDELKKYDNLDVSSISVSPMEEHLGEEKTEQVKPPTTAASLFSLTNEKMADLFQKFSAKVYSATYFESNNAKDEQEEVEQVEQKFEKEKINSTENECFDTGIASNEPFSAPGTITAKLFYDKGLLIPGVGYSPDSVTNKSHFVENIESTETNKSSRSLNKSSSSADVIPINAIDDSTPEELNKEWTFNNKFVHTPKNENKRKKSIRKILFSALSKDSETSDSNISKDTTKSKLSWSRSLLRSKTSIGSNHDNKMRKVSNFNMDSGESLETFAAEYSSKNDLTVPKRSKDSEIIEKIIDNTNSSKNKFVRPQSPNSLNSKKDDQTIKSDSTFSPRSISEYIPTPLPRPRRQRSLFFSNNFGFSRSKTYFGGSHKRELSIRFAPTPEYISDSRRSKKSRNSIDEPVVSQEKDGHSERHHKHRSGSIFKKFIR